MKEIHLNYIQSDSLLVDQYEVDDTLFWDVPIRLKMDIFEVKTNPARDPELITLLKTDQKILFNLSAIDSLVHLYPESRYLMASLINRRGDTMEDVKKVYNGFSEKTQQSYLGQKVAYTLLFDDSSFIFENIKLPAWDTKQLQYVIQDTTKYTLIMFSASWCIHCHERIPLLKEIYKEKKDLLDMIYISVDDHRTVSWWPDLMRKEQIPWSSVVFSNDDQIHQFLEKYVIKGVPAFVLVSPNQKSMTISLLTEEDKMNY